MKIEKATPVDADSIAPIFNMYREFYAQPGDLAAAQRFLRERLENNESVIFIAREGHEILGFTQLYPSFSSTAMRRLWILNDLFVIPSARRRSIGHELMARAESFSRETEARGLNLKTAVTNVPAQQLYESRGWKRENDYFSYIYRESAR